MKRVCAAAFALTLAVSSLVWAQARPDLSGSWTLDMEKSDPAAVAAGRGGGFAGRGGGNPNQIVIRQTADELFVTQNGQAVPYKFDGSETAGPPGGETHSTAAWDGGKLVITWKREYYAGVKDGYVTSRGKDVYTRAETVLTIEKTATAPQGQTTTRKLVYNKS